MRALRVWLIVVACLRMLSVVLGYLGTSAFKERVFTNDPDSVTGIAARSFSMWTLLTCTICLLTAFNLCNKQLYYLCIWSFIVADGFFFLELFVYQTTTIYTTLSPFAVANISILWMYIERPAKKCVAQSSKKE